jgi:hypothetical protein
MKDKPKLEDTGWLVQIEPTEEHEDIGLEGRLCKTDVVSETKISNVHKSNNLKRKLMKNLMRKKEKFITFSSEMRFKILRNQYLIINFC